MCPLATALLPDISHNCSNEDLFMSLEKIVCGGPLPGNVTTEINPYNYKPENLPVGLWYLTDMQNNRASEHGSWTATGEPNRIFSNDCISGWRTTFQFCDRQASDISRADWLMEEYMITQNGMFNRTEGQDASALCRVVRNCLFLAKQDLLHGCGHANTSCGTSGHLTHSLALNSSLREGEGSTSNRQVNNVEAGLIVARDNPINRENLPEAGWEDFLEENDLDIHQFSSSNSDNSSCLTMSSDESFDGLLQDIENEIIQDIKKKDADHRFNKASVKPDKVVSYALPPGSSVGRIQSEIPSMENQIVSSLAASAVKNKTTDENLSKQGIMEKRQPRGDNLPPARPQTASIVISENMSTRERRNKADGKMKMLKKLCFMPF